VRVAEPRGACACGAVNPRGVQRVPGNEADVDVAAFSVGVEDDGWCVLKFHHSLRQSISVQDHFEKEPGGLHVVIPCYRGATRPPVRGSRMTVPIEREGLSSANNPKNGAVSDELELATQPLCLLGCQCGLARRLNLPEHLVAACRLGRVAH
jgi:hypothetical protein